MSSETKRSIIERSPSGSRDRKSTRLNSSHVEISYAVHRHLHSFPTRRSSDLLFEGVLAPAVEAEVEPEHLGIARRERPECLVHLFREEAVHRFALDPGHVVGDEALDHRAVAVGIERSEEHTSELQSRRDLVCRPPPSPLFPYTTLFRSSLRGCARARRRGRSRAGAPWHRAAGASGVPGPPLP